jgi:hypothetical protein
MSTEIGLLRFFIRTFLCSPEGCLLWDVVVRKCHSNRLLHLGVSLRLGVLESCDCIAAGTGYDSLTAVEKSLLECSDGVGHLIPDIHSKAFRKLVKLILSATLVDL